MKIEKMSLTDLEMVEEIEKENFVEPWPKQAFLNDINRGEDADVMVLKEGNEVIGYYDLWYMFENADLANIAIKKSYQGKGLGEKLLIDCIKRCIRKNVEFLHLEVRISNPIAIGLYKKYDFRQVRIRKGYYNGIDGIDMVKGLIGLSEEDIGD